MLNLVRIVHPDGDEEGIQLDPGACSAGEVEGVLAVEDFCSNFVDLA